MVFNSIIFLLYLPIVFLLYWFVFKRLKWQNIFVIIASYIFYGWWDWRFLTLIAFTSLCSFLSGILIDKSKIRRNKKIVLSINIIINLGILAIFKYFNFFTSNIQLILSPLGIHLDTITLNLILPVGISFYTFQALSYSIDVYRGKISATNDIFAFFAFISFFPQLVAGPIERATNLLPQFLKPRVFDYSLAVDGCRQILWGLFKKMVIADNCSILVNETFSNYSSLGGINLWIGALFFTFQIYGDFSGYSDIAIGTAKLFDIRLMTNFKLPYFSRDIAEFWRRWHISLNTWFVDYVYIPLGGSRHGKSKLVRNTFVIFLLSGLWHGAEWTFVLWGTYNAILFIPLTVLNLNKKHIDIVAQNSFVPSFKESLMMGCTFMLVMVGWVIFRADNLQIAVDYLTRMFTDFHFTKPLKGKFCLIYICIMLVIEWLQRKRNHTFDFTGIKIMGHKTVRWIIYCTIAMMILMFQGENSDFIYFQF